MRIAVTSIESASQSDERTRISLGYKHMDLFSRTMLACSAEAGLTTTALARHVPLLRRNIRAGDQVSLLSRGVGSDGLGSGDHILMLTGERMVVTRQSRLLGRVRLCLDAPVSAIENLRWSADPAGPGVELNFTVLEGPGATEPRRWHFWLPATHAKRVWRVDALLARAFRRPRADAWAAGETSRPANPDVIGDPVLTETTVRLLRPALVRPALADAALAEVLPVGTALPASPLPDPDPRLLAASRAGDRPKPSPLAGHTVGAPTRPDFATNANRPGRIPAQPADFQPTGFESTLAPA
jgi:hypothetical protein